MSILNFLENNLNFIIPILAFCSGILIREIWNKLTKNKGVKK